MKAEALWSTVSIVLVSAAALAFITAILSSGISRILFAGCGIILIICVLLTYMTRVRYLAVFDRESMVDCLKMKRAGIVRQPSDEIVPKGKMPCTFSERRIP